MALYFSTSHGFFDDSFHSKIPENAAKISKEDRVSILDALSRGNRVAIENGVITFEAIPTSLEETPSSVTKAQGKAALIRSGLWQGVVDFVNSISDPVEKAVAEVALNDTTHWQRSSPFLNSAAEALGLTDEQLDQLFIDASQIEL